MEKPQFLDDVTNKLNALFSSGPAADIDKNIRAVLTGAFARLDLVTREEFDVQREVLARTRARLEALEAQIAALESNKQK